MSFLLESWRLLPRVWGAFLETENCEFLFNRERRAQENKTQRHCSSTAAKSNPTGSCSATSLMLPLGYLTTLFLCATSVEGCPLTFCWFSVVEWLGTGLWYRIRAAVGELTGCEKGKGSKTSGAAARLAWSCRPAVLVL